MLGGGAGGAGRGRGRGGPRQPTDDKPKSQLSAEAKEWFPPNYVAPQQENFYQVANQGGNMNYYNHNSQNYRGGNYYNYHGNHNNQNYYQQGYDQGYGSQRYSAQDRIRFNQNPEEYELNSIPRLIIMLEEVTYSPGRFATLSGPLVDAYSQTLDNLQYTRPLVDAIVNQAIKEQNFRYSGARLCTMFDVVEPQLDQPSVFRSCLLERCNSEEVSIVSGTNAEIDSVCGFAMFLAELYMQFENPEGGRIKALGESLCKILKHMLGTPDNNSTKTVCQVLKLSGLALDADCKLHVDDIFTGLRASESVGVQAPLVRNLINLRQSRWGSAGFAEMVDSDTNTPTFQSQAPPPPQPTQQNGGRHHGNRGSNRHNRGNGDNVVGMFYLPEGHALTVEEAAFLNQHLPPSANVVYSDEEEVHGGDSDNENWEPGIDDEQQADFLEFLRSSNQIAR